MIELTTVANLALFYLLYCLINRYVRDRSVFGELNKMGRVFGRLEGKRFEKHENGDILKINEDIPVLKIPVMPKMTDLNIDIIRPDIRVETSFSDRLIGEYKPKK